MPNNPWREICIGYMPNENNMKKTLLKFPSAIYLVAFRRYSKALHWEIDLNELTVLCDCTKKELQVACSDFGAEILLQSEKAKLFETEALIKPTEMQFSMNAKAS